MDRIELSKIMPMLLTPIENTAVHVNIKLSSFRTEEHFQKCVGCKVNLRPNARSRNAKLGSPS